jgi:hypothetical protein
VHLLLRGKVPPAKAFANSMFGFIFCAEHKVGRVDGEKLFKRCMHSSLNESINVCKYIIGG